jgi:peptidoglycan/xylan/chitin deacetylase (PgdA/CDA1 family)
MTAVPAAGPDRTGRVPILVYHSVTTEATDRYRGFAIDPGLFREQMAAVVGARLRTITVDEMASAIADRDTAAVERAVALTFDDGFREVHGLVLPVLRQLDLRATAYLVSAYIGGTSRWLAADGEADRPLMSWTEVRELASEGVEIGAHGHRHVPLDLLRLSDATDEVVRSRQVLEEGLGRGVTSFAYPYGYHTGGIKAAVQKAGYTNACGVKQAISHLDDDRFGLARIIVYSDTKPETLRDWLAGDGLPLGWRKEKLVTRAWRAVRRVRARLGRDESSPPSPEGVGT